MQGLEEDSEEHRAGLFIPAPVQGDCTGQWCSRDGRTPFSDPAALSCGFMVLILMELLSIRAHVVSGHGCLCNTERLPSDLPASLVAMEQDSPEWPGAIQ